jgi:CheY-like chemotaxis protein
VTQVLVVHADAGRGDVIAAAIAGAGLDARAVTSGERAMDLFIQEPADVIVVDPHLEGRDGIATIEAIRWMPGGRRARVVVLSDEAEGVLDLATKIDAFESVIGPLDLAALTRAVSRAAAARPHEAETRVLSVEQVLLEAERARPPGGGWDENTAERPIDDAAWEWRDTDGRAEGREVRALAEEAEHTHSDLVGTFERMPFARLLRLLADRRASGALVCVHPRDARPTTEGSEPTKIVYFRAGVPVHVRSNLVRECLGQVLVRQHKIGPETLRESLAAVRRGEGLQGEVLLQMGALTALDLSEALADQLREKLAEIFAWEDGTFRFAAERTPDRPYVDLGLGLAEIVMLGVSEGMSPEQVHGRLAPSRDRYPVLEPRALVRFLRLGASETIRSIDGTRTLGEVLERASDARAAAQLLYAMECLDAVRYADAPAAPRSEPADDGPEVTPVAAAPDAPSPPDEAALPPVPLEPVIAPALALPIEPAPAFPEAVRPNLALAPVVPAEPLEAPPTPRGSTDRDDGSDVRPHDRKDQQPADDESSRPRVLDERVEALLAAERHFRRGTAALDRGRPVDAVRALARAAELCPDEGRFLSYLGWAKHAAAPDDAFVLSEAVDLAERGVRAAPELAIGQLLCARLLGAVGRSAEARAAYRRALELDPGLDEARSAIAGD